MQCGRIDEAHRNGHNDQIDYGQIEIGIVKSMLEEISTTRFGHDEIDTLHYGDCEHGCRRNLMIQTFASIICLQGSIYTLYIPADPFETHPFLAVRVEYIVLGLVIPIVT